MRERGFFNQLTWELHALFLLTHLIGPNIISQPHLVTVVLGKVVSTLAAIGTAKTFGDSITNRKKDGINRETILSLCHI